MRDSLRWGANEDRRTRAGLRVVAGRGRRDGSVASRRGGGARAKAGEKAAFADARGDGRARARGFVRRSSRGSPGGGGARRGGRRGAFYGARKRAYSGVKASSAGYLAMVAEKPARFGLGRFQKVVKVDES